LKAPARSQNFDITEAVFDFQLAFAEKMGHDLIMAVPARKGDAESAEMLLTVQP
jgi:hypothetical protein